MAGAVARLRVSSLSMASVHGTAVEQKVPVGREGGLCVCLLAGAMAGGGGWGVGGGGGGYVLCGRGWMISGDGAIAGWEMGMPGKEYRKRVGSGKKRGKR